MAADFLMVGRKLEKLGFIDNRGKVMTIDPEEILQNSNLSKVMILLRDHEENESTRKTQPQIYWTLSNRHSE